MSKSYNSLVMAIKKEIMPNASTTQCIQEVKALSDKDKEDLRRYFAEEGTKIDDIKPEGK